MNLDELRDQLPDARLRGENREIDGVTEPGEGTERRAEIWMNGPVDTGVPAIADADLEIEQAPSVLLVPNLKDHLRALLNLVEREPIRWGIHPTAVVADDFQYEERVYVGPGAVVGAGVRAGRDVRIGPGVTVHGDTSLGDAVELRAGVRLECPVEIGDRTVIHANSVIGADGYGYEQEDGQHKKVPQLGRVRIGEDVEIGALTCVDRATFGYTRIGSGTKIDNLVQIAHNCDIGPNCIIVSMVGIAGSTTLGEGVVMGGQAATVDHVTVADGVSVAARGGVTKDITESGRVWSGFYGQPHREEMKQQALIRKLPELRQRLKSLEKRVETPEETEGEP